MDELHADIRGSDSELFRTSTTCNVPVLSLRYMDARSEFVSRIQRTLGCQLPGPLKALEISLPGASETAVLSWRSPTETLVLARSAGAIEAFSGLPLLADGYMVDLTGALSIVCCNGRQIQEVFARLGGPGILPAVGEAKRGRLAELPALALCVREGECQILIEHYYAHHLEEWIRQAVANLERPAGKGPVEDYGG